jgi:hypothetical protein
MKNFLIVFLVSLASMSVFAGDTQPSPVAVSELQALRNTYGLPIIKGVVTNVSINPVKEVFVKFNLYDEQGNLIGNTIDHASNLEPGARWVINAQSPKEFHSFKITEVKTY